MRKITLVSRQIVSDWSAVVLLAGVLAFGALLGTAAPRWVDARLDDTLRQLVDRGGRQSELAMRIPFDGSPDSAGDAIASLRRSEPNVANVFDEGRWSASVGEATVETQNGVPNPPKLPRIIDVRVPDGFADDVRLVEGELPREHFFPPPLGPDEPEAPGDSPVLEAVATPAIAEALGLEVGDVLLMHRTDFVRTGEFLTPAFPRAYLQIRLTGLVEPTDPDDPFWSDATTTHVAGIERGGESTTTRGALLTAPDVMTPFINSTQTMLGTEWHLDVEPGALQAGDVDAVATAIRRVERDTSWRTSFDDLLDQYAASRGSAERASALAVASLAGLVLALLLLSLRLLVDRRWDALALTRSRGARAGQLGGLLALEAVAIGAPAVAAGVAAGIWLFPGSPGLVQYVLPAALLVVAVVGLPATGIRLARRGMTDRPEQEALHPSPRRLVLEAGVVAFALAGLWLLASRQNTTGSGVDPVVSFAPVLAAAAAGLLTFRLVPFVVAAVLRWMARSRGATPFLAAARSARSPGHAVLPVIAMLVAVGVAAFGSTVQSTVERAQEMSSWNAVKADAAVETSTLRVRAEDLPALIPAATAVAAGYTIPSQRVETEDGQTIGIDLLAVDVPAWQRVNAGAPAPVDAVSSLAAGAPDGAVPGVLKGGVSGLGVGTRFMVEARGTELIVEIVDEIPDFPGTAGSSTVVLPEAPLAEGFGLQWPTVVYVAGDVQAEDLAEALEVRPDQVTLRADARASVGTDPVLDATLDMFRVALVVAALLAGAAAVLGLLLTARTRSYALSILRTLGLTTRQASTLVAVEVVPTSIAAACVGVGVGLGVGLVSSRALDLTGLTGLLDTGSDVVLDVAGTALAAAGILAVVLLAVTIAVIASRRARLGTVLRAGDPR